MTVLDVAVPLGSARPDPDPLRWVLRTIEHHLPHGRLYLATPRLPDWVDPTSVRWLQTPELGTKWENIGANLDAVLASDISDRFYWWNDDIFLLTDFDTIPLYYRAQPFGEWVARHERKHQGTDSQANYFGGLSGQYHLLEEWGWPSTRCFDCHTPMPVDRALCASIIRRMPHRLTGHFRAVYGAATGDPGVEAPAAMPQLTDCKWKPYEGLPPADWPIVSVDLASWSGDLGQRIRALYWQPSEYER